MDRLGKGVLALLKVVLGMTCPWGAAAVEPLFGLRADAGGVPARFVQPDRGEPIPYLVDAQAVPAGITTNQALAAVEEALAAWAAVSSVRFVFDGLVSFGQPAAAVMATDGRLRIQLHDLYNWIPDGGPLVEAGGGFAAGPVPGWGGGGNVNGHEFHRMLRGHVTLKHTAPALGTPATFTEVLCHGIGRALGLNVASEDPGETDPGLRQSILYFQPHQDGRGATLGDYDAAVIQQVHPAGNTPPFSFPRVMDITTSHTFPPPLPGVNEIELRGYDLQHAPLTVTATNATALNGTFTLAGSLVRYTATLPLETGRLAPGGHSQFEILHARFSDGTNASPSVAVRVISFNLDTRPFPAGDGIPDNWMTAHFGDPDPAAGPGRDAADDADGDRMTNFHEFLAGSDPADPGSKLQLVQTGPEQFEWPAKPYELYELQHSTNLTDWRVVAVVQPTNSSASAVAPADPGAAGGFYRVLKAP